MRDIDGIMPSLIAGLVGSVAGILFASLFLSAYSAATAGMRWGDLSNVATFWGGHLTALSILIIGAGLLIQARQLRAQIEAERNLARRSSLEWLSSQLPALGSGLCAYYFDASTTPPRVDFHRGLQQFAAAVLTRPHDPEDVEVWVDNAALVSYVQAAKAVKRIESEISGSVTISNEMTYFFVYHRGVCEYGERMLKDRAHLLQSLRQACNDETAISGCAEMLNEGWRFEESTIQGIHYVGARRLEPILRRVDVLRSNNASLQSAWQSLVQKWTTQYQ